jgi:hypothetical protein
MDAGPAGGMRIETETTMVELFLLLGMAGALGFGVYVGLGAPGMRGREDRVVESGRAKRLQKRHIDLLKQQRR